MPPGSSKHRKKIEILTFAVRLAAFVVTLIPLAALILPWVTLDGTGEVHTGAESIALLATPVAVYMFSVSPLQAGIVSVGPILVVLLAVVISYNYHRRRSIAWGPPAMLAIAVAIFYGAGDLVTAKHYGLVAVMLVSTLLTLHQIAIRVQVVLRRRQKLPIVYRASAIATGTGSYRWSER